MNRTHHIIEWFKSLGVVDICICPGGRNSPFVSILKKEQTFNTISAFDERSAGFFAYGRATVQQKPAVVITTSGTAAAEVLPSVIEAFYSATPLLVVTADRPHSHRGTGSPQVIDQKDIYGHYVEKCIDIDVNQSWVAPQWSQTQPLHINISFDEPLIDGPYPQNDKDIKKLEKPALPKIDLHLLRAHLLNINSVSSAVPLLILGPLHRSEIFAVEEFCKAWPGLIYAEASSGLRELQHSKRWRSGDHFLSQLLKRNLLSGVLRIGGVPTVKLWRELETSKIPVTSISSRPFSGLARGSLLYSNLTDLADKHILSALREANLEPKVAQLCDTLLKQDHCRLEQIEKLYSKYPLCEPSLVRFLSQHLPQNDTVYIGNSLPVREWDAFANDHYPRYLHVNRGANGIDGQICSAIGMCAESETLSVVVGDLTALYDLSGPWFKSCVRELKVFVINNNGGRIFEKLFNDSAFYNAHNVDFSAWAKMWGLQYFAITDSEMNVLNVPGIYEVLPDYEQTQSFWRDYAAIQS